MRGCYACVLFVTLAVATPVHAGQIVDPATGSIVGTVRDASGAVVPGVAVTVSSQALMTPGRTSTRRDGTYLVAGLPPGDYTLVYSLQGFTNVERTVRVSVAFTATVDVGLSLESQRAEITVSSQGGVLDRRSAAVADTFDSRQLADLPSSRSLAGLVALTQAMFMPAIEVGGGIGLAGGSFSAYGKNSSPRHTLEGIVVTGLFGFGFTPDYGAFSEVSVLTAAHGAEWPTAGIHTEMVTKSGGNRYTGTFYGAYENRAWQSVNVDAGQVARFAPSGGGLSAGEVNQIWNYHDANADVGGFVIKDRLWWYGSIRDQETAARLVNFPVEPFRTRLTNVSGKATFRPAAGHTVVGYGQRGRNHQPFRLDPSGLASGVTSTSAINTSASSTANQLSNTWVWKAEWDAVVNDALLFNVRAGQFGSRQDFRARSVSPRFEDIQTLVVSGGNRDTVSDARRNQLFGTVNYFKNGWLGSHHFKAGGEAIRFLVHEAWLTAFAGDVLHLLQDGSPSSVVQLFPSQSSGGVWTYAGYLTDSWRFENRLTLSLGLRVDRYRLFLPAQAHVDAAGSVQQFEAVPNLIDWNVVAPRIAAAYDLTGRGTTLVKGSYARYRSAPNASTAFNANPNPAIWSTQYKWIDDNKNGVWEWGEEVGNGTRRRGGVAVESLDPALDLAVADEAGAWIERELPAGIGLRSGVVWRRDRSHFTRQNVNQPYEAFTVPVAIRDPGADSVPGTTDDGGTLIAYDLCCDLSGVPPANVQRNVPGASSAYWTWEVEATRRARGRWSLGAGFSYTWNGDQASGYSGQAARGNPYPLTPNDLINTGAGGRHEFTTWTATAHGTYEAPWNVRVTPVLRHQSGQPFGRTFTTNQLGYATAVTLLAEPIGSRRMDNITIVDLRMEKRLSLKGNRHLSGFLDLFNCFNANPEQNVIWSSGPSFLRPLTIVSPRVAKLGLSFEW